MLAVPAYRCGHCLSEGAIVHRCPSTIRLCRLAHALLRQRTRPAPAAPHRNDVGPEYRAAIEAGAGLELVGDLLLARRSTARQDLKRSASVRLRDRRSQRGRGARCATPRHVFVPRHKPSDDAPSRKR
jgi:hypothetical protein